MLPISLDPSVSLLLSKKLKNLILDEASGMHMKKSMARCSGTVVAAARREEGWRGGHFITRSVTGFPLQSHGFGPRQIHAGYTLKVALGQVEA